MKHRNTILLLAGAVLISSCSTSKPRGAGASYSAESDASGIPYNGPTAGQGGGILEATPRRSPSKAFPSLPKTKAAQERPGLATRFGDTIDSAWDRQSFDRASSSPAGTAAIYYNDREGIEAMSGYPSSDDPVHKVAGGLAEWGIKGGFGYLPSYTNYQRSFVVGRRDGSYSIFLKNACKSRLEFVLSVDGLDVIDGKPASFSKRGYVVAPGKTLEVKGWRTSPDTVARFQFSTVSGSYANLARGETRNVGVVGLAVFTEKGVDAWKWMPREVEARETANPFTKAPGQN